MATKSEPFYDPEPSRDPRPSGDPKRSVGAATPRPISAQRGAWAPPKIVRHGSVRHLVRGISGFFTDGFGMPGMSKM